MSLNYRAELEALADSKYRDFSSALIPNIEKQRVIGVRLPQIRKLASEIIKGDWRSFLASEPGDTLEEKLLRGFVIAAVKVPFEEHLRLVESFVPLIDCWSVCDSFTMALKFVKKNRAAVWDFIAPYFDSKEPYDVRFAVVMTLAHFSDCEYAGRAFEIFNRIDNEDYYVKMAVAWAVSVFFVHAPNETWGYLRDNKLDDETYNKALRKITESLRVSDEDKKIIRTLKRRNTDECVSKTY